jgi:hypothetical protein
MSGFLSEVDVDLLCLSLYHNCQIYGADTAQSLATVKSLKSGVFENDQSDQSDWLQTLLNRIATCCHTHFQNPYTAGHGH